ncbi:MAG: trypsin-like peptidase domain-containing protein [Myxococcota bacterium]
MRLFSAFSVFFLFFAATRVFAQGEPPGERSEDAAALLSLAAGTVAVVQCDGHSMALAFLFEGAVITTSQVSWCRRSLEAVDRAGQRVALELVRLDAELGAAEVRPAATLGLDSLPVQEEAPNVGSAVQALTASGDSDETGTLTFGRITGLLERHLRTDASPSYSHYGAPVLHQGALVGLLSGRTDVGSQVVSVDGLRALLEGEASEDDLRPRLRGWAGYEFGLLLSGREPAVGLVLNGGLSLDDRWTFRTGFGLLGGGKREDPLESTREEVLRLQLTAAVGHRFRFQNGGISWTLEPWLGATLDWQRRELTTSRLGLVDPNCSISTDTCETFTTTSSRTTWHTRLMPSVGIRLGSQFLVMGYQFQLDTTDVGASQHLITLGFGF